MFKWFKKEKFDIDITPVEEIEDTRSFSEIIEDTQDLITEMRIGVAKLQVLNERQISLCDIALKKLDEKGDLDERIQN